MTGKARQPASIEMMSSVMPSAKNSCSGSPPKLANGNTAMARRSSKPARLGERLDPRRDVDAVAEDVAFLDDDVAEIDADPHRDALFIGQRLVHFGDCIAQRRRAARGL